MSRTRGLRGSTEEVTGLGPDLAPDLETCLRACATHSGKLVAGLDRRRSELAEVLRQLLALYASRSLPAPAVSVPAGGGGLLRRSAAVPARPAPASPRLDNALLDALLTVAHKALDCGYEDEQRLAACVSETLVTLRAGSRAAWRLHARVLETSGAESAALVAYERYLDLTEQDGFGVRPKVNGMRVAAERRHTLLRRLAADCPRAAVHRGAPVTETWTEGLDLAARGDWESARALLTGALLTLGDGASADEFQDALGQYLDLASRTLTHEAAHTPGAAPDGLTGLNALLADYAELRRNRMRGPVDDPTVGGVNWLSLGEFRNHVEGRSVCLVANSGRVGASTAGPRIDAYDLVVRFNSYRLDPAATGSRTDIHVTIHKHGFNWEKPVTTRLVFGGDVGDWRYSLRNRLVPGAQRNLGDESLRWPLREIGKVSAQQWPGIPTSGFNMLYLLDFLDVSPVIDLIGFDFYESGAYRTDDAMKLPITSVHEYSDEKTWVMERAQHVDDMRIALR